MAADQLQHCPDCDEEYVAGIAACVECGKPLTPGPLPRLEHRGRAGANPAAATAASDADTLVAEIPGKQADQLVRMLLMEGITCRVRCQGVEKTYLPGQPPAEPFAVTLSVAVFVAASDRDAAADLLAFAMEEDAVGEQWNTEVGGVNEDADGEPSDAEVADPREDAPAATVHDEPDHEAPPAAAEHAADVPGPPRAEGTAGRLVALAIGIALVLLYLFLMR